MIVVEIRTGEIISFQWFQISHDIAAEHHILIGSSSSRPHHPGTSVTPARSRDWFPIFLFLNLDLFFSFSFFFFFETSTWR